MAFEVEFSVEAERDLSLILSFLVDQYAGFEEAPEVTLDHAPKRVRGIQADAARLAKAPYRGTLHNDILPGLRHVTIGKAIFWFDIRESAARVIVLGVFFGMQEHRIAMLRRLLDE